MKKLLWVGDAACPSGFALATHQTLASLDYRLGGEYDCTVLGINYFGDPHPFPYPIYSAAAGIGQPRDLVSRSMGVDRLPWMCEVVEPDVVVVQQDPWNIPAYVRRLEVTRFAKTPLVASLAVDGKNCQGGWLRGVTLAVFWTQFGLDEARHGGYKGPAAVIPLGVDLSEYHPCDKVAARRARTGSEQFDRAFIVGNVNRNQPRKRWDLTIRYFAEWMKRFKIDDAFLYLHVAPTGDVGCDIKQLAQYYGVFQHLLLREPPIGYGDSEEVMRETYNCLDVSINTGQGEGFGLTALEAMACGVPVVAGDWSGLGDWARGAIWLIKCSTTCVGMPYVNVIGGVPDEEPFIQALQRLYSDPKARETNGKAALERANNPRFRWANIGQMFSEAIGSVLENQPSVIDVASAGRVQEVQA